MRSLYFSMAFKAIFVLFIISTPQKNFSEVCKVNYKGTPEELNGQTVKVSENVVAISEQIKVHSPTDSITTGTNSSVFFIIDHSGSMVGGYKTKANDQMGSRFTVTSELLDTIYSRNPNTEVGLAFFKAKLYMDPFDEPDIMQQIDPVNPYNGAYLKLLKLNETYISKKMGKSATGYEICKYFLSTHIDTGAFDYISAQLDYVPTAGEISQSQWNSGTNISLGFDAAKMAFKEAKYDSSQHYIVFFSDGEATSPNGTAADTIKMFEYKDGKNVPTTFTVFFTPEDTALTNLETMTENIKNNGYSETNPTSDLYTIETSHDALMKLLMDNVIGKILEQVNSHTPIELSINNTTIETNWNGEYFSFNDLFPLTGVQTDFDFQITYKVKIDTFRTRADFDTIITDVNFTVEVEDGYSMPDTFETICWDRTLKFYHNGSKINAIDITMNELELRFTSIAVDTFYNYENIDIEVSTKNGDNETFRLIDQTGYFNYKFSRETASANSSDGKVQHENPDSIIAVFRNPTLPLDTLRVAIPYSGRREYVVQQGTYFDNNADGSIDSIFFNITPDTDLESVSNLIISQISLPSYRNFEIQSNGYSSGGVYYKVNENRDIIETFIIPDEDKISIDSLELNQSAFLQSSKITFIDSMAPVILSASLVDSVKSGANDILTVIFSEKIQSFTSKNPFNFFEMPQNDLYTSEANSNNISNSSSISTIINVNSSSSSVKDGDSICIKWDSDDIIKDIVGSGNQQDNPSNRRVEISVTTVEEGITMTQASYHDNDANGKIDSIAVKLIGVNINDNLSAIVNSIKLPGFRKFDIASYKYESEILSIIVTQNINKNEINTAVTEDDFLEIENTVTLKNDLKLLSSKIDIADKVSPVILSALYEDSIFYIFQGNDTLINQNKGTQKLTIEFSEAIKTVDEKEPFNLFNYNYQGDLQNTYSINLTEISQSNDLFETSFKVNSIINASNIEDGDSINISFKVFDTLNNEQTNDNNLKSEIEIRTYINETWLPEEVEFELKATLLDYDKSLEINKVYNGIEEAGKHKGAMVIIVESKDRSEGDLNERDSLAGDFSIYDCIGNQIVKGLELQYDRDNRRLIYVWLGENLKGRNIGSGSYLILANVKRLYVSNNLDEPAELTTTDLQFKKTIGIKY